MSPFRRLLDWWRKTKAVRRLRSEDELVRLRGLRSLAAHPDIEIDPPTLDALLHAYERVSDNSTALEFRPFFVRVGEVAVPRLAKQLAKRPGIQTAPTLAAIGRPGVPPLLKGLESRNDAMLRACSEGLHAFCREQGRAAADLAPALLVGLDKSASQPSCLSAIKSIAPAAKDVVLPGLAARLRDGSVPGHAIGSVLKAYGFDDVLDFYDHYVVSPLAPSEGHKPGGILAGLSVEMRATLRGLFHWDERVRHDTAMKVRDAREPRLLPLLILALKDDNYKTRHRAAEALGELGSATAVGPLIDALSGEEGTELQLIAAEALEKIGDRRGFQAVASAFANRSDRLTAEWATFGDNRGNESFSWMPGNFVHAAMYRRGLRMLRDPASANLPKERRIALWWYVGRFGLLTGVPPRECLTHFEEGIALSPPSSHNIVLDHRALTYALEVLGRDHDRARALRRQVEDQRSPFYTYFKSAVHEIARAGSMPSEIEEFS